MGVSLDWDDLSLVLLFCSFLTLYFLRCDILEAKSVATARDTSPKQCCLMQITRLQVILEQNTITSVKIPMLIGISWSVNSLLKRSFILK